MSNNTVNPNMIIVAREARGLSQQQLAKALNTTQARISKVEMGLLSVSSDLHQDLSRILGYPLHFFEQQGSLMGSSVIDVFHQKYDVSRGLLSKIHANIDIRMRHIITLLRSVETPCTIQRFDVDEYRGNVEDIARIARAKWASSRGPVIDMTRALEDTGIIIVLMDFETTKLAVISRWLPTLPPVFFVNERCHKDELRIAMAHELGHIIMHDLPNADIEGEADRFAVEFLLPEREIYADLQDLDIAQLANLKKYWRASMMTLLKRAEALEAITSRQKHYLRSQMIQAGYKHREPIELDVIGEEPSLLNEVIETHRKGLGYSIEELCQVLAINEDEMWSMYLRGIEAPVLKVIKNIGETA